MALTLSGTNGVVGAGFTLDASGASVTAGVGTFGSLNAPAAGLTGALPAISAASLTQIPAANIVGVCTAGLGNASGAFSQGITMADQWRVVADFTPSQASTITSNWERNDVNFSYIGSGMSESSGEFTFPQTGIYKVTAFYGGYVSGGGSSGYSGIQLRLSTDSGSSYSNVAASYQHVTAGPTNPHFSGVTDAIIDVTNYSTFRVKLLIDRNQSTVFFGATTKNMTGITFIRLGDT